MKKNIIVCNEEIIKRYDELNSSYKVAESLGLSPTLVKRVLAEAGVLRTLSEAASRRIPAPPYKRTEAHRKNLSDIAKSRTGEKNHFYGKTHSEEVRKKLSESAKKRTEERNPNYKHGEYQRRPRDYKIAEFKPIRNFVFNRDKHTCVYCSQVGNHLHAHHLIPYWVCEAAFLDVDNLITVCTKCHFENAHLGNWSKFDTKFITDKLILKYNIHRERLSELAGENPEAIVRPSDIYETEEIGRNDLSPSKKASDNK
jgi:5-methylcytosine-specific restriction protein A